MMYKYRWLRSIRRFRRKCMCLCIIFIDSNSSFPCLSFFTLHFFFLHFNIHCILLGCWILDVIISFYRFYILFLHFKHFMLHFNVSFYIVTISFIIQHVFARFTISISILTFFLLTFDLFFGRSSVAKIKSPFVSFQVLAFSKGDAHLPAFRHAIKHLILPQTAV